MIPAAASTRRDALRRAGAFAIDWLVIAAWGAVLFAGARVVGGGQLPRPLGPWAGQALGFVVMTAPVALGLAALECGRAQASIGKRVLGLRVADVDGRRLTFGRSLLRNVGKLAPWECGHLVAHHAIAGGDAGPPAWVYAPMAAAFVLPAWWLIALFATGCTPYDRWARARVTSARAAGP